jgi:hypothetical protein
MIFRKKNGFLTSLFNFYSPRIELKKGLKSGYLYFHEQWTKKKKKIEENKKKEVNGGLGRVWRLNYEVDMWEIKE